MPNFILPEPLDGFLAAKVEDHVQIPVLARKLSEFIANSMEPTKKFNKSQVFYSFDINYGRHFHRAIFDLITIDNIKYLLLRDIAWAHNYEKALQWTPLGETTKERIKEEYKSDFCIITPNEKTERTESTVYYNKTWFTLTPPQQQLFDNRKLPSLMIGPPGSGKTLFAANLFQQLALEAYNERVVKLLYLTDNPLLINKMKRSWDDFCEAKAHKIDSRIIARFITINDYQEWYAEEKSLKINDEAFKKLQPLEQEELIHNSYYLERDVEEKRTYDDSEYKKAGSRNSLFTGEDHRKVYERLFDFLSGLKGRQEFVKNVSAMPAREDPKTKYDFIIVDEAQKASISFLLGMLDASKNQQVLFIGDTLQKESQQFSPLSILPTCIWQKFKVELTKQKLDESLRVPAEVTKLLNEIVLLYGNLNEGKADAESYTSIPVDSVIDTRYIQLITKPQPHILDENNQKAFQANPKEFKLLELNDQGRELANFGLDAQSAVIILDDKDKAAAEVLIQGHNVFNAHSARGLEFPRAVLYLSHQVLEKFIAISLMMETKGITPDKDLEERHNQSPKKENKVDLAMLSELLIALSRSKGHIYIYLEMPKNTHKLRHFLNWFKAKINPAFSPVIEVKVSTKEDWLQSINNYIIEGAYAQAHDNLVLHLNLDVPEAKNYITHYKNFRGRDLSLSEFNDWLNKERQAPVVNVAPKVVELMARKATPKPAPAPKPKEVTTVEPVVQLENPKDLTNQKYINALKMDFTAKRFKATLPLLSMGDDKNYKFWESKLGKDFINYLGQRQDPAEEFIIYEWFATLHMAANDELLSKIMQVAQKNMLNNYARNLQKLKVIRDEGKKTYSDLKSLLANRAFGPLHMAAYANKADYIKTLVECAKVDLDLLVDNMAPIYLATLNGCTSVIRLLAKLGANLSIPGPNNVTPAHIAAQKFSDNLILEILGEGGANFNTLNNEGTSPIGIIVKTKNFEGISILKKYKADFNAIAYQELIPVIIAVKENNTELLEALGRAGANFNQETLKGITAMHLAANLGFADVISVLAKYKGDVNYFSKEVDGTPAICAAVYKKYDVLERLAFYKADFNLCDSKGTTLAHYAAIHEDEKLLDILRKYKVNFNIKDKFGNTPIHLAAKNSTGKILRIIHQYGGILDPTDYKGNTPAMFSVATDNLATLQVLQELGADLTKPNAKGYTILHLAAGHGRDDIVKFLIKNNFPTNITYKIKKEDLIKHNIVSSVKIQYLLDENENNDEVSIRPYDEALFAGYDKIAKLLLSSRNNLKFFNNSVTPKTGEDKDTKLTHHRGK